MKHLLLGLLGSSLWLCACKSDCELNDSLRLFAGDAALDCGTAHSAADRDAVDQCATDAFEAGSAFIARYERMGVDSNLVVALASNSDGKLKLFRWDSAPCGSSSCDPVTDVQSCEKPSATEVSSDDPTALPISCESLGLAERICT